MLFRSEDHRNGDRIDQGNFVAKYKGLGPGFDIEREPFILAMLHPVTTEYGTNRNNVETLLHALSQTGMPVIMLWPNADAGTDEISKGIRTYREQNDASWLNLFINLPIDHYIKLMDLCACAVGNSSSALREGAFIGVPAVNIGTRQNGRMHGDNIIFVDTDTDAILQTIKQQVAHGKYPQSDIYGTGDAGTKLADILAEIGTISAQKRICY